MATLVLLPTKKEFLFLTQYLTGLSSHPINNKELKFHTELNTYFAVAGIGHNNYFQQCKFIHKQMINIERLICCGGAGAINPERKIYDIILADKIIHQNESEFISEEIPTSDKLSFLDPTVTVGPIVSYKETIDDPSLAKRLFQQTKAEAVAWEGYAGFLAAKEFGIDYTEIRAITDFSNNNANHDFFDHLEVAMKKLASFLNLYL